MNNLTGHKILILGAKGMLGQDLARILGNPQNSNACPPKQNEGGADYDLVLWDKEDIDIGDDNLIKSKIGDLRPKYIINCAAYTAVDECETHKDLALRLNSQAVGYLAQAATAVGAVLLHISTDYVFNGQNKKGYQEDSQEFGPINFYGESKLLGEKLLKNITDRFYLVRTSWLYGKSGKNFVETMLKSATEQKEVKVVNDQFGKPTYTIDLAKQILYILSNSLPFGIYHASNETKEGGISWYEFAQQIFKLAKLQVNLIPCSSTAFPRPAQRPAYSALINTKLPQMRDWETALMEYMA